MLWLLAEVKDSDDVWKIVAYAEAGVIVAFATAFLRSIAQNRADLRELIPLTTRFLAVVEREEKST